jgi:hypothetical protein
VEAVNFDSFLLATSDLSSIRGAGLLLLRAPERIGLKAVSIGGSTGLFEFEAADPDAADVVRRDAERRLSIEGLQYATFVADVEPLGNDVRTTVARLVAKNRWRQMRSPSVVMPEVGIDGTVCALDDIGPATDSTYRKGAGTETGKSQKIAVSAATVLRRDHGIEEKFGFYESINRNIAGRDFVNDLDEMTDAPGQGLLNNKMCLVYLDGNRFSKMGGRCVDLDRLRQWFKLVKDNQNAFLKGVLDQIPGSDDGCWTWSGPAVTNRGELVQKRNVIRLETLQWGGDELTFVVPAWLGWWFLGEFYRTYGGAGKEFDPGDGVTKLTHGAGLVFCHHKAPIHRVWKLAGDLADAPKSLGGDRFAYQVLESFDHLGTGFKDARERLTGLSLEDLAVDGSGMHKVPGAMNAFRAKFPRNKLFDIAQALGGGRVTDGLELGQKVVAASETQTEFTTLLSLLGGPKNSAHACWIHIAELWDYTRDPRERKD